MRLNGLHQLSTTSLPVPIREELLGTADPNLDHLSKMIQKQGKDPGDIIKQIQMKIGTKGGLKEWIRAAKPGESKEGRDPITGRKIRIAVLDSIQKPEPIQFKITKMTVAEAVTHDLISERFMNYDGVGREILAKLHDILSDEPEPQDIKRAESKHPTLSHLMRYAQNTEEDLHDSAEFWALVDKITSGKGDEIKKLADHINRRQIESREKGGITVAESNISTVMKSLGLNEEDVRSIMQANDLQDTDYDVAKLDEKEVPPPVQAGPKKSLNAIRRDNYEYIQSVILAAEWVLDSVAAGQSDQEIDQAVSDPSIVSDEDLAPEGDLSSMPGGDDGTNRFLQNAAEYETHGNQPSGHF